MPNHTDKTALKFLQSTAKIKQLISCSKNGLSSEVKYIVYMATPFVTKLQNGGNMFRLKMVVKYIVRFVTSNSTCTVCVCVCVCVVFMLVVPIRSCVSS